MPWRFPRLAKTSSSRPEKCCGCDGDTDEPCFKRLFGPGSCRKTTGDDPWKEWVFQISLPDPSPWDCSGIVAPDPWFFGGRTYSCISCECESAGIGGDYLYGYSGAYAASRTGVGPASCCGSKVSGEGGSINSGPTAIGTGGFPIPTIYGGNNNWPSAIYSSIYGIPDEPSPIFTPTCTFTSVFEPGTFTQNCKFAFGEGLRGDLSFYYQCLEDITYVRLHLIFYTWADTTLTTAEECCNPVFFFPYYAYFDGQFPGRFGCDDVEGDLTCVECPSGVCRWIVGSDVAHFSKI